MKPINSVISGLPSLEPQASSSIGPQHGETGSVTQARERLLSQSPKETDQNLIQWLTSSLQIVPQEQVRLTYPVTGGYQRELTGYTFRGLTDENRSEARRGVNQAMTPAELGQCEEWVVMMHAVMAKRSDEPVALKIILKMYSQCLSKYPADVAQSVVNYFCTREEHPNFFPTLSELKSRLDKESTTRRAMFEALNA